MYNLGRRSFVKGAGALAWLGALRGGRVFAAESGLFSQGTPNLTFGILTDIHVSKSGSSFAGEAMFRKALGWFRDQGVDAVAVCGDMADTGLVSELEAVAGAWSDVFPNDASPTDGRHVERLFIYGNHDYGEFNGTKSGSIRDAGLAVAWRQVFGEEYAPVWRKEVKGYTFVGAHWTTGRCKDKDEVGVPEGAAWIAQNGASIDPSKPFFYIQHAPPKDTCLGPWHWGRDDGRITSALSNFPNAVAITGHSHASVSDERSIWQGAFTAVNAGSLRYTGLEYGDLLPTVRENDGAIADGSGRIMARIARDDGHHGLIARVYDDRIVFERRDFEDLGLLGPDWVVPLPVQEPVPLAFAARAAASVPPEFPAGAEVSARLTGVIEVDIPAANREGCPRVLDYALEIEGSEGGRDERFVFAEGFHRSSGSARANAHTVCKVAASTLTAKGELTVKVTPRDSFGKAGAAISTVAVRPAAAEAGPPDKFLEYVESTSGGNQWIDTGVVGKCNTKAEMKVQWNESADKTFLGTLAASGGDTRFLLCATDRYGQISGGHRIYDRGTIVRSSTAPDHVVSSIMHDGAKATVSVIVNGSASVSATRTEAALDTGRTMYLFARHEANGTANYYTLAQCHGVKIWQMDGNGAWQLVRDYLPCEKGGRAGLYDTVSGEIFYSRSAADFVAGPAATKYLGRPDHFIQYVESTGTQYIDTEVVGRPNTAMQAHVLWYETSDTCFLGSRVDGGNTRFVLHACNNPYYMAHRSYSKAACSTEGKFTHRTTEPDFISSGISHDGTTLSYWMDVNGIRYVNQSRTEAALDTGLSMYLFAQNKGGAVALPSKVRCYDLKIWQDDVLVRDFRPCLKNGRAGMYDAVSGWIYFPQGGELNYPNDAPDKFVKWVNVPGTSYVPTGVFAENGVAAQMKVRPADGAVQTLDMASGAPVGAVADGLNLFLFATNANGNPQSYFAGRFYSGKMWAPDAATGESRLVRDFKPCVKDNSIMFFDVVSQTMFRPYPAIPADGNFGMDDFGFTIRLR